MTTSYAAFGLRLDSEVPLPELPPADGSETDTVTLRRERLDAGWREGRRGTAIRFGEGRADLWWEAVGAFRVTPDAIGVEPNAGVGDDLLAFPLLGPVLAALLLLRRSFVLHASAVALEGGPAFALLGDKGAGKSTTAAAFLEAGHRLLTDDLVVVEGAEGAAPRVLPGWGQVKLSAAAEGRFASRGDTARPQVHEAIDKTRVMLEGERFSRAPAPLARLYLLERGPAEAAPEVLALEPEAALSALSAHAYALRFGTGVVEGRAGFWHFRAVAGLAGSGRVARLLVPAGLDRLGEVVALVRRDAGA
jgi:hypothetical protein